MSKARQPVQDDSSPRETQPFSEVGAWRAVGGGWYPLFGGFRTAGFSFEWHDFDCSQEFDWGSSFHPGSVELCLNLRGNAMLLDSTRRVTVSPRTFVFYCQGEPPLSAVRHAGERHQFITVEFSREFLVRHFADTVNDLLPLVSAVVRNSACRSQIGVPERLPTTLAQLIESLRHPPVFAPAQAVWFQCKALELAAQLFFRPAAGELFCTRQQRAALERVERARAVLREKFSSPPSLEELGRQVGCSPFYLSRTFSQETGMTIQQYLRQIRMERAAELLRTGRGNVTEVALEVGYNSLSHFSAAFHQTFGCCPGLYPLKTQTQRAAESGVIESKPFHHA
ncbi:MAG: AraC family transcriptional regulator [Pedosphaera sp.]|nr:AraC family transcriptional regulator [Pedosphaera sp.]